MRPLLLFALEALVAVSCVNGSPSIGIVTMNTPDIMSYANVTELVNRQYADRWRYGFHTVDHAIDPTRVPHWSKLHAVQLFLPEYDFLLWIDADAVFFDHTRNIENVMDLAKHQQGEIWAQDIWPDYPSIHRKEEIDTGVVLFRNSRWTRKFLLELYWHPSCQAYLNWTEQYCFTLAYRENLLGMRDRMVILPTPTINHHILPPPQHPNKFFILHLAGRPTKARAEHFAQVHEGRAVGFHTMQEYRAFWRFHELFSQHHFGGIASLQVCLFGIGDRHRSFLDALLFHFPYVGGFTIVRQGAPALWSQMKATEDIGERFPDRMAHMDVNEYLSGVTRDGKKFIEGFFCDIFILGVESWRHLPSVEMLGPLARSGLENYQGEKNQGFGYSPLRDAFFVWLYDGCDGGQGAEAAAAGGADPTPAKGVYLDGDDEDGAAMAAACDLLDTTRNFVMGAAATVAPQSTSEATSTEFKTSDDDDLDEMPALWGIRAPGELGIKSSGNVAIARVLRKAFPKSPKMLS